MKRFLCLIQILVKVHYKLFYRVKVYGREHLPTGPYIIAANHTSAHDPILLGAFLHSGIHFMAKEELFRNPVLHGIVSRLGAFPVSRSGSCISAIRHSLRLLKTGKTVGIFPEGKRNRLNMELPAKPGVGFIAVKSSDVKIVPVVITVRPRQWFKRHYILVGEPIQVTNPADYRGLAKYVLKSIYDLKDSVCRQGEISLEPDAVLE